MKYMGSKNDIAKYIVPIINKFSDREFYIEPFVGGANIIDKLHFKVRKGYDKNPYLIDLLKHISLGSKIPTTITEYEYYKVRDNKNDHPNWYVGLVGFCASYGGRFFEGFPRGNKADGTPCDYTNEAIRNLEAQRKNIEDVIFHSCDYSELDLKDLNACIYCDPPYRDTKPYKVGLLGKFDSDLFFEWCRKQSEYNPVLISEYSAPDDFICIWEKEMTVNLKKEKTKIKTEKLFIHKCWIDKIK